MMDQDNQNDLAQNLPLMGSDYFENMALFGNINYQIMPSQSGEVSNAFGTVPYTSLNLVLFLQQIQAATNAANIVSGSTTGTQNLTGTITAPDSTGTTRYMQTAGVSS